MLKQFLAGIAFPAIIYPVLFGIQEFYGPMIELTRVWWVPLLFGAWNLFYFALVRKNYCIIEDWNLRMLATGASLGVIIAVAVIWINQFSGVAMAVRLVSLPLFGALIWRYVVSYFNELLKIKE